LQKAPVFCPAGENTDVAVRKRRKKERTSLGRVNVGEAEGLGSKWNVKEYATKKSGKKKNGRPQ